MLDVLLVGGGNAALCAALMARRGRQFRVLLLEASHQGEWRGGNSQHTRNLRCMHDAPQDVLVDAYPEEEYWQDLLKVTGGRTNEALARLVIRASSTCRPWMRQARRALPALAVGRAACTARAPMPSSWAGARPWSMPTTAAQRSWACRFATTRRSTHRASETAAFLAAYVARRTHRGQGLRAGRRRLRVQPGLAARGLGPERTSASGRPTTS